MDVTVARILKICAYLPGGGFFLCLILSLASDWTKSVDTVCRLPNGALHHPINFLPSISMMISGEKKV